MLGRGRQRTKYASCGHFCNGPVALKMVGDRSNWLALNPADEPS